MTLELNLRFPDPEHVVVRHDGEDTAVLPFAAPLTEKDHEDLRWYVEIYGAHSLGDPDDGEAARIRDRLPAWGKALFEAVFRERSAERLFNAFQDADDPAKLITVSAEHPAILALPWELLHESSAPDGSYLFHEHISLRRRYAGAAQGRRPFKIETKPGLHLLFVVSRPEDAGFIDPRADAEAVLDAIDRHAPGRVTVEFLRPPTLDALVERLEDSDRPAVDILHFDGHGVFDRAGGILAHRKSAAGEPADAEDPLRDTGLNGAPNTGYLLFEDAERRSDLISAGELGAALHRRKVALVILSACQSAAQGEAEPLGSVAARLTAAGIPAVLAMPHSVLVATTRILFGEFYKALAQGRSLGVALDLARALLDRHPEKYEVQRGETRVPLRLYDWFIPALYQSGEDKPLLHRFHIVHHSHAPRGNAGVDAPRPDASETQSVAGCVPTETVGTMTGETVATMSMPPEPMAILPPLPEAGFFGRRRELWEIERSFAGPTRRLSLTGFGGQGKTTLALEAGRWLLRTGLFRAAAFVNYAETPSRDAVAVAVAALAVVMRESLPDAGAATAALRQTPCLVILDNLEILKAEALAELLDAAKDWSEAGGSRVLLTSRRPEFPHAAYRTLGTERHRRLVLDGLGRREQPDDALEWFAKLWKLPPAPTVTVPRREALIDLFDRVGFHPLSIRGLAAQLKTRRIAELGERLEALLAGSAKLDVGDEDHPAALVASLHLSLDRLDPAARALLPRLGVFQGGALENQLLAITEIPADQWPGLRQALEAAALLEAESLPVVTVPFLRFHPTLAPLLWLELDPAERERLGAAHRARYYELARVLYHEDDRNPHAARAIARRELPNLLHAVRAALQREEPEAVEFVECVNRFLGYFGLRRELAELTHWAEGQATESGSEGWYLSQFQRGEQLLAAGHDGEAMQIFQALLEWLGVTASYQRAFTLNRLGRCSRAGGWPDRGAQWQQQALALLDQLEPSDDVNRLHSACLAELGDALMGLGRYPEARQAYLAGLAIAEAQKATRQQGAILFQLATLALKEGQDAEALQRYQDALKLFQALVRAGLRRRLLASDGRGLSGNPAMECCRTLLPGIGADQGGLGRQKRRGNGLEQLGDNEPVCRQAGSGGGLVSQGDRTVSRHSGFIALVNCFG